METARSPDALKPAPSAPRRHRALLLIGLALLLITGSLFLTTEPDPGTIIVTFPSGNQIETEVANTPQKIFFGLAFREHLPEDEGMLYIFDSSDLHRLNTKGFKIPVDMMWLDESRYVVYVVEHAEPCVKDPCPIFGPPPENARYVIQTAAGFIRKEGVKPGAEVKFTLRM